VSSVTIERGPSDEMPSVDQCTSTSPPTKAFEGATDLEQLAIQQCGKLDRQLTLLLMNTMRTTHPPWRCMVLQRCYLGIGWVQSLGPQAVGHGIRVLVQVLVNRCPVGVQHSSKDWRGVCTVCDGKCVHFDCILPLLCLHCPTKPGRTTL